MGLRTCSLIYTSNTCMHACTHYLEIHGYIRYRCCVLLPTVHKALKIGF